MRNEANRSAGPTPKLRSLVGRDRPSLADPHLNQHATPPPTILRLPSVWGAAPVSGAPRRLAKSSGLVSEDRTQPGGVSSTDRGRRWASGWHTAEILCSKARHPMVVEVSVAPGDISDLERFDEWLGRATSKTSWGVVAQPSTRGTRPRKIARVARVRVSYPIHHRVPHIDSRCRG